MKASAAARRLVKIRSTAVILSILLATGTSVTVGASLGVRVARNAPQHVQPMPMPSGTLADLMASGAR